MSPRTFLGRLSAIASAASLVIGCSVPVFTEPVTISTRHFESFSEQVESAPVVSGRSCSRLVLLFIPLGFATANGAFNDALANSEGADTLVDWHMKQDVLAIVGSLIYFENCIVVEGKAVNSSELVASAADGMEAQAFVEHWRQERDRAEKAATEGAAELARRGGGTAHAAPRSF
jgi:hypothetical protein